MSSSYTRSRIVTISILCLTSILLVIFWYKSASSQNRSLKAPNHSKGRILVIAPHPDDESLGTGGLIADAVTRGDKVKVVFVTNGDGSHYGVMKFTGRSVVKPNDYLYYGRQRQKEAIQAAAKLGVRNEDVIFLGFPDQGLARIWLDYWDSMQPYTSHQTKKSHVPYNMAMITGEAYTAPALINILLRIFEEYSPTDIYVTGTYDCHPDHWASGAFTFFSASVLEGKKLSFKPRIYTFDIHRADWRTAIKDKTLMPPSYFLDYGDKYFISPLSKQAIADKKQALSEYKTQILVMPGFFKKMKRRSNEVFCLHDRKYISNVKPAPGSPVNNNWPADSQIALNPISKKEHQPNSVLKAAYLLQDGHNLSFRLTTQGKWSSQTTYLLNLYVLPAKAEQVIRRYSLKVTPQAKRYQWLVNPIDLNAPVQMDYQKDRIDIKISNLLLPHEKYLMLNIDTQVKGRLVDRLPWDRLILKELITS